MPHIMTHRPRVANLRQSDETHASHQKWETFNAISYEIGGLLFVVGSICYFPALSHYLALGSWLYFVGSVLYLLVTGHDLLEVIHYWKTHHTDTFADTIERITAISYVIGSILFTVGSLCFLPSLDATLTGIWCFIIGSALFMLGGFINMLQVVEAPSLLYMQLFNLTVAQFIVGSALFLVATIPYMWHLQAGAQVRVENLAAGQFLFASLLFLLGGIAIFYRKLTHHKLESFCHASGFGNMFIHALKSEIEDKATLEHPKL